MSVTCLLARMAPLTHICTGLGPTSFLGGSIYEKSTAHIRTVLGPTLFLIGCRVQEGTAHSCTGIGSTPFLGGRIQENTAHICTGFGPMPFPMGISTNPRIHICWHLGYTERDRCRWDPSSTGEAVVTVKIMAFSILGGGGDSCTRDDHACKKLVI